MKVTEVSVHVEGNINLNPYNNIKFSAGIKATLDEGDDHTEVTASLFADARAQVVEQAKALPGRLVVNWIEAVVTPDHSPDLDDIAF